jgi:signal transduction histidine kinase/CheY-like chemotaxis protein
VDLITIVLEVLFGALFLATLVAYLRRRDSLSRDVMLVFASIAMLFVLVAVSALLGPLPQPVIGGGVAILLAQPVLTLRLAHRVRAINRWVRYVALVAYLATALPLVVAFSQPLVLLAVAVFVVTDLLAAYFLGREARRRSGSAQVRLSAAAAGSALLSLTILGVALGPNLPLLGALLPAATRIIGLASALLYVLAFLPPRWLRRLWSALTTFEFTRHLTDVEADADAKAVWTRLAELAARLTGTPATLVLTGTPDGAAVVAVGGDDHARQALRGARFRALPRTSDGMRPLTDEDADLVAASRPVGARYATVLPIQEVGGEVGALLILRRQPSLFAADDHEVLASLVGVATVFAERARVIGQQAALAAELGETVKALEQASQAKSDFLASMSHELRTPLSAIIGFSALMRDEPLTDGRRLVPDEWVEHVHSSGQHLLALINDVLDLTKIEAGRIDLEPEPFDLSSALSESVEGLRPLAERKSLQVTLQAEPGQVRADRGRLRQIVYNLLSNAIKFTPDGGSITVESRWRGDDAHIAVTDTGVGIAAADLGRIFEEFSQVGDLKAREAGTGLGLALSRRLAQAHGGEIRVTSEPGRGSRFEVVLPGARVHGDGPATTPAPEPGDPSGARVLVIEDEPGAIRLLRTYLEAEGYSVQVATDGEAGIHAARAQLPDAIILDILLPGLDGWEVLRRLKADPEVCDVPVVVVTVVDERNVAMSLGAVDYFLKPVDPDALLARLGQYTFTTKVRERAVSVLAIDDDAMARQLIADTLEREGFSVVAAASGGEGLAMAAADPPELVICDLVMPDMDGYEVVNRLRAAPATRDATILILTAHDLSTTDRERLNGKVADVLQKGEDLRPALRSWLERAASAARRRGSSPVPTSG